jgi:hypothetical protein
MNRSIACILLALAACGGTEIEAQNEDDATARYQYKCPGMHRYVRGNDIPQDFWLLLSGKKGRRAETAAAIKTETDLIYDDGWTLGSGSREYVRFKGPIGGIDQEIRVEPDLRKGGYNLLNGSMGGYAKIISRAGEGYDSWSGICFRQ